MEFLGLIIVYIFSSLIWKWVISWGGAEKLEGWRAFFLISWFAGNWNVDQIKLYALLIWIVETIGLILKFFFMP